MSLLTRKDGYICIDEKKLFNLFFSIDQVVNKQIGQVGIECVITKKIAGGQLTISKTVNEFALPRLISDQDSIQVYSECDCLVTIIGNKSACDLQKMADEIAHISGIRT